MAMANRRLQQDAFWQRHREECRTLLHRLAPAHRTSTGTVLQWRLRV